MDRGYLVGANPTVYTDSFETSLVFWSWSEIMHVVWILSSDYFLLLFCMLNLAIFRALSISLSMDRGDTFEGATPPTVLYRFF